ncbi:MAG TPA: SBBP repeat-containing protein, partial [Saprospiraceae bacterium]|nr:SBBP repeat-containing protein [Saprospiraceae bacterium]
MAALLLVTLPGFGQALDWVNQPLISPPFGSDEQGRAIARDASGNVYVTGYFNGIADFDPGAGTASLSSAGGQDIFIAKYDASGNYVWAKQVGGPQTDMANGIAVDGSGNVYIPGYLIGTADFDPGPGTTNLNSAYNEDVFIAKYDASGNYVWAKKVGGTTDDIGYGIAVDGSGNVHITGYFKGSNVDFDPGAGTANLSSAPSGKDVFIAKYDASGNYVWAKQVGGTTDELVYGYGIAVDGSGNVHITGSFEGFNVDFDPGAGTANLDADFYISDIFIAKYDVSGNYVWAKRVGGTSNDIGYGIAVDGSGNVHMTGYFQGSNVDFDPGVGTANLNSAGSPDIFLAKYDASGNYLWANQVGGTAYDIGYGVAVDGSGNAYMTGYFSGSNVDFDPGAGTTNLSAAFEDIFLAKYDASGNYVWAKQVNGPLNDAGTGIAVDGSGNAHITGYFSGKNADFDPGAGTASLNAGNDNSDAFILRLLSAGSYQWAINMGRYGSLPTYMECRAIARDASGNVYATGLFEGSNVDFDPGAGTANLSSMGLEDVFIAKYDASGNYLWAIQMGGA